MTALVLVKKVNELVTSQKWHMADAIFVFFINLALTNNKVEKSFGDDIPIILIFEVI